MTDKNGDLLKGLFIGGLIGMVLGVLFAPKSGKETREEISRKANELLAKAKEEYENAAEKGKLFYESSLKHLNELTLSAKEEACDTENQAGESAQQGAESKNRFKKAIDAGIKAYKDESNKEKI